MDAFLDDTNADAFPALSYDDSTAYEEQLPSEAEQAAAASLANRIGSKVYLLSDTTTRLGKRKLGEEEPANTEDVDMDGDTTSRGNALLLYGTPISNLPTARLFAYATHFEAQPLGLEWVDDERCVFVFDSKTDARTGYKCLQKHISEEPDADGYITAKPIPVAIWPPDERINNSLGKGQGLKGTIRMRWAKSDDVKKRGAKNESQFYKKHGWTAGKESYDDPEAAPSPPKRRRRGSVDREDNDRVRAALDAELDAFINGDDDTEPVPVEPQPDLDLDVSDLPAAPTSKMRSDYIGSDGRSLLQRTSVMRVRPDTLESRLTAPLPQRSRPRGTMYADSLDDNRREEGQGLQWGRESRRNGGGRRDNGRRNGRGERGGDRSEHGRTRNGRPAKTAEDLDAELDAFLLEDKI